MGKLRIDGSAYLAGAVCLLLLPLNWLLAAFLAAVFHEGCHALAIYLTGCRICSIHVGSGGTVMETDPMSRGQELISSLAGPAGSLCLLLFARWIPRIALCAAVQGMFNLLPVFPLDGSRVLRGVLRLFLRLDQSETVAKFVELTFIVLILIVGAVLSSVYRLGLLPFTFALFVSVKALLRKIPCKPAKLGVQ